jgi:beta-glucanase (GH16 family)
VTNLDTNKLVWHDEFDESHINPSNWTFQEGTGTEYGLVRWGNSEEQFYRRENASIRDGCLVIKAKREDFGGMRYTSARLNSIQSFKYGKIAASIKLPAGDGFWPAFWLMPKESKYGAWAASGEIDIMENRGRLPGETSGAAHYGGTYPANTFQVGKYAFPSGIDITSFHEYSVLWCPDSICWMVDGNQFFQMNDWGTSSEAGYLGKPTPFDQEFYVLLNLAVGGHFDEFRIPKETFTEAEMLVDYVRVYAL